MRRIVHDGILFDKTAIDKNLTLFLYPDDSDEAGRETAYLPAVSDGFCRSTADPGGECAAQGMQAITIWQIMQRFRSMTPIQVW